MALLLFDGLDAYGTVADLALVYPNSDTANLFFSTSAGRFGGGAFAPRTDSAGAVIPLPAVQTDIWTRFALRLVSTSDTSDRTLINFQSATGIEGVVALKNSTRALTFYRGSFATNLGSSASGVVPFNVYTNVEIHYLFHSSAGVIEIWIDGTRVLNLTGVNTKQNTGETGLTQFQFKYEPIAATDRFFDDIYCLNTTGPAPANTRLGDCRIALVQPNSDAAPNNGTPTPTGAHWSTVDDNPGYNSADYVTLTNTVGQEEKFGVTALPVTPTTILGVNLIAVASKSDAGAANAHLKVTSGAASANGAALVLSTNLNYKRDQFVVDPNTGLAWTPAAVGAMKIGYVVD